MCLLSWIGCYCENYISFCFLDLCKNNVICYDVEDMFFCICDKKFIGRYCDVDINECQIILLCKYGGFCVNIYGFFVCICLVVWMGELCEVDVDECKNNFCL